MERLRNWALRLIVVLNVLATVVAFGESYSGLYQWAIGHQITGFWGGIWPLMIDVIVLVAEAGLFVAHHDHWRTRHKAWLWTIMMVALGVSVGGNTGHIQSTDWLTHLTAALPPLALAFSLTVGFGVMKRTFLNKPKPAIDRPVERVHVGTTPWVSVPADEIPIGVAQPLTEMVPVPRTQPETKTAEKPAPVLPPDDFDLSETLLSAGFKVTDKSFQAAKDPRPGLDLKRRRVRDAYDVDPDVTTNALAKALEISWATAAKYLAETKEARGLELTDKERSYLTSTASS